ncbi:CGNR zinc finger domain-containing protein [Kitasatospora sp. NPDC051853]|uniref:CGNR zinc finger domain-containing protein n=1 Tax=Kitasatospora sp. NPDC051853 TaxID=3364058 RepID=UPI0037B9058B
MADPLIGEPLALDLLNTRPRDGDRLADPAALRRWLELQDARGLLEVPAVTGPAELAAVREVRELAAVAVGRARRGEPVPGAVLDALNARLLAAPLVGELRPGPAGPVYRLRRTGPASARLAGELAEAVAELLTGGEVLAAVRDCAAEDCGLVFVPVNPRRRWCSPATCGNRARVARHYRRRRDGGGPDGL